MPLTEEQEKQLYEAVFDYEPSRRMLEWFFGRHCEISVFSSWAPEDYADIDNLCENADKSLGTWFSLLSIAEDCWSSLPRFEPSLLSERVLSKKERKNFRGSPESKRCYRYNHCLGPPTHEITCCEDDFWERHMEAGAGTLQTELIKAIHTSARPTEIPIMDAFIAQQKAAWRIVVEQTERLLLSADQNKGKCFNVRSTLMSIISALFVRDAFGHPTEEEEEEMEKSLSKAKSVLAKLLPGKEMAMPGDVVSPWSEEAMLEKINALKEPLSSSERKKIATAEENFKSSAKTFNQSAFLIGLFWTCPHLPLWLMNAKTSIETINHLGAKAFPDYEELSNLNYRVIKTRRSLLSYSTPCIDGFPITRGDKPPGATGDLGPLLGTPSLAKDFQGIKGKYYETSLNFDTLTFQGFVNEETDSKELH